MPNNSHRRCSSWLYIQTCLALHSSDWKNRRCNPPWRFLLLYEPKSVSHTFPSVYIHLINTADKTVQHQLSATMPGQRYKDELVVVFFFFSYSLHPQTLPCSRPDVTCTYNKSDIKWWHPDSFRQDESCGESRFFPLSSIEWDYERKLADYLPLELYMRLEYYAVLKEACRQNLGPTKIIFRLVCMF